MSDKWSTVTAQQYNYIRCTGIGDSLFSNGTRDLRRFAASDLHI